MCMTHRLNVGKYKNSHNYGNISHTLWVYKYENIKSSCFYDFACCLFHSYFTFFIHFLCVLMEHYRSVTCTDL